MRNQGNEGHGMRRGLRREGVLLAVLFAAMLLAQQVISLPGGSRLAIDLQNAAHTPWFFVVTLLAWGVLRRGLGLPFRAALLLGAGGGLLLAVLTEFVQFFSSRDASMDDIVRDLLGMIAALALITAREVVSLARAAPLVLLSAAAMLAGFFEVGESLWFYRQRAASAPVLVDAQSHPLVLDSLRGRWRRVPAPEGWHAYRGREVLEVSLNAGSNFPGLRFREPLPDWSSWRALVVEAFVDDEAPLPLTVRAETRRDRGMERAAEIVLLPGANRKEIPLHDLIGAETDHLPQVRNLLIFSAEEQGGRKYYLGSVRLE